MESQTTFWWMGNSLPQQRYHLGIRLKQNADNILLVQYNRIVISLFSLKLLSTGRYFNKLRFELIWEYFQRINLFTAGCKKSPNSRQTKPKKVFVRTSPMLKKAVENFSKIDMNAVCHNYDVFKIYVNIFFNCFLNFFFFWRALNKFRVKQINYIFIHTHFNANLASFQKY